MSEHQPQFNPYLVIPSYVSESPDIEPRAVLLYGHIVGLSHREGYCWASNQHLANLNRVDVSTIKRWIKSLSDAKFIIIETDKTGIHWQRKIWISQEFKRNSTKAHFRAPPSSFSSPPQLKNEPPVLKTSIKEKEEGGAKPPPPPSFSFFYDDKERGLKVETKIKLTQEEYDTLCKTHGEGMVIKILNSMHETSINKPHAFNKYKSHYITANNWVKKQKEWDAEKKAKSPQRRSAFHDLGFNANAANKDPSRVKDYSK